MANQASFYFKIVFLWKGRCDNIKLQNYPADYLLKLVEKLDTFVTLSTFEQFVTLKYCISQLHYTTYYCQIKNMINNIWYKVKYQICSWKFSYFEKIEKFQFWRTIKKHDHGAWSSEGFVFVLYVSALENRILWFGKGLSKAWTIVIALEHRMLWFGKGLSKASASF